jgi:hypothetical protein
MALTLHTNVVEERGFVDLTQADYLEPLFDDMDRVLELAERRLEPIDFDTIVVTGMSGALVGAPLAHHLHKHLVVVRKADDKHNHSWGHIEGHMGHRWIFVDDLVSSGDTRSRVHREIEQVHDQLDTFYDWPTEYVGEYMYLPDRWRPAGSQRPSNPLGDLFAVAPPLDPGYQTITDADF